MMFLIEDISIIQRTLKLRLRFFIEALTLSTMLNKEG